MQLTFVVPTSQELTSPYDNVGGATHLEGADLRGAKLRDADLRGATYSCQTQFPDGFSPESAGMMRIETT
jgi:hypothetical protein